MKKKFSTFSHAAVCAGGVQIRHQALGKGRYRTTWTSSPSYLSQSLAPLCNIIQNPDIQHKLTHLATQVEQGHPSCPHLDRQGWVTVGLRGTAHIIETLKDTIATYNILCKILDIFRE